VNGNANENNQLSNELQVYKNQFKQIFSSTSLQDNFINFPNAATFIFKPQV